MASSRKIACWAIPLRRLLLGFGAIVLLLCLAGTLTAARPPRRLGFEEVNLWDVSSEKGMSLWRLEGAHRDVGWYGSIRAAAFSADGKRVAVPAGEGLATVWDTTTGRRLHEIPADPSYRGNGIESLAFLPGGDELIAADAYSVKVRNLKTGASREIFEHHCGEIVFASQGRLCACGQLGYPLKDHGLAIYDALTGKERRRIRTKGAGYLTFTPDGKRLATIQFTGSGPSLSSTIQLWDATSGEEVLQVPGPSAPLAFSPDGAILAMRGDDRTEIILFTISTGERKSIHHGYLKITALAFSPDGRSLACAGLRMQPRSRGSQAVEAADGIITLWDTTTGERQTEWTGHTVPVQVLAFSPDGRQLVSAGCQYQLDPADTDWIASHGYDDEPSREWLVWLCPLTCLGALALVAVLLWRECLRLRRTKPRVEGQQA